MLTPDQLAAIKTRCTREKVDLPTSGNGKLRCYVAPAIDLDALLVEMQRLTRHNQRMSQALAQLSDKENWYDALIDDAEGDAFNATVWGSDIDPQQLAERALVEDG